MNWIEALQQTYDFNIGKKNTTLVQIYHTYQNFQVVVQIDEKGDFRSARIITDKADIERVIPCTENSASRVGEPSPHGMHDKLEFIVFSWPDYVVDQIKPEKTMTVKKKNFKDKFDAYLAQLSAWAAHDPKNVKLNAVLTYIKNGTLLQDLADSHILPVDDTGALIAAKARLNGTESTLFKSFSALKTIADVFVAFECLAREDPQPDLTRDTLMRNSWISFIQHTLASEEKGLCQVTGAQSALTSKHPNRIRNAGDMAKLVSSNDDSIVTYRGRFDKAPEACGIGYEVSQKAHCALRWLIKKQGTHHDTLYIVAWAVSPYVEVPKTTLNTVDLIEGEDWGELNEPPKTIADMGTAEGTAKCLDALINGYGTIKKLNTQHVVVMLLDSATKGRIAVKCYRQLEGVEFLENLKRWHLNAMWKQFYSAAKLKNDKQKDKTTPELENHYYGAPAPYDIAQAAYGSGCDAKFVRNTVDRMFGCFLDGTDVPSDILNAIVRRLCCPRGLKTWEFNKNLSIACSLYNYNHKRSYAMTLENERRSRDYLYGRLLAVADYAEDAVLRLDKNSKPRTTHAVILMQYFSAHPYSGWTNIYKALNPYLAKMRASRPGLHVNIERLFAEIHNAFLPEDFLSDKHLSGEFLLGYYCQRAALFAKKEETADSDETDESPIPEEQVQDNLL